MRAGKLTPRIRTLKDAIEEVVEEKKVVEGEVVGEVIDRDRLCCDILNTSVMAALVGGFALGNMQPMGASFLENLIYTMSCFSVHACT